MTVLGIIAHYVPSYKTNCIVVNTFFFCMKKLTDNEIIVLYFICVTFLDLSAVKRKVVTHFLSKTCDCETQTALQT